MSEIGESITRGLEDALAYMKGDKSRGHSTIYQVPDVDVRELRQRLGLSRPAFAARFGFRLGTVRDWEQRRRQPDGPARAYLVVIDREPKAVMRALATTTAP